LALVDLGRFEEAKAHLEHWRYIGLRWGYRQVAVRALHTLANIHARNDSDSAAAPLYKKALHEAERDGIRDVANEIAMNYVRLLARRLQALVERSARRDAHKTYITARQIAQRYS